MIQFSKPESELVLEELMSIFTMAKKIKDDYIFKRCATKNTDKVVHYIFYNIKQ